MEGSGELMAIQFENAKTTPELVYNRVFMTGLTISQSAIPVDDIPPRYKMRLEYRLYAVDPQGNRHYKNSVSSILIDDYYAAAVAKAQAGDFDLANAEKAIEQAVRSILEDQTELDGLTVV
jgi:hypothetical protein